MNTTTQILERHIKSVDRIPYTFSSSSSSSSPTPIKRFPQEDGTTVDRGVMALIHSFLFKNRDHVVRSTVGEI